MSMDKFPGNCLKSLAVLALAFSAPDLFAANEDLIRVRFWLFRGSVPESICDPTRINVYSAFSFPAMKLINDMAIATANEPPVEFSQALIDSNNLDSLDFLFSFDRELSSAVRHIYHPIVSEKESFRIDLAITSSTSRYFSMHVALGRVQEEITKSPRNQAAARRRALTAIDNAENLTAIAGFNLDLPLDEPGLVKVPSGQDIYFVVIVLTRQALVKTSRAVSKELSLKFDELSPAPPLNALTVPPYPDFFREQGIGGKVDLLIRTDKSGRVQKVVINKPLHPYLDYLAMQAFRDAAFKPPQRSGKNAAGSFLFQYDFQNAGSANSSATGPAGTYPAAVEECLTYCDRWREKACFFACEQIVKEYRQDLRSLIAVPAFFRDNWVWLDTEYQKGTLSRWVQIMDPQSTRRSRFICDLQLANWNNRLYEIRRFETPDRRQTNEPDIAFEKRISNLNPILGLLEIFDRNRVGQFDFKIVGDPTKVAVVEAATGSDPRKYRIWFDRRKPGVLRLRMEGIPFEGFDDVLKDAVALGIEPSFEITHDFEHRFGGLIYPSRTTVRVEYKTAPGQKPERKYDIGIDYKKYKFFSVQTSSEILKET